MGAEVAWGGGWDDKAGKRLKKVRNNEVDKYRKENMSQKHKAQKDREIKQS